jgi:type IV pilus assembly protein PilQ
MKCKLSILFFSVFFGFPFDSFAQDELDLLLDAPTETNQDSRSLENIEFFQEGDISKLEISLNQPGAKIKKFHVVEDKQIIIDLENVKADAKVMRAFDTSEFSGTVVFVSPYKKPGTKSDIRLAIQLRDNARSIIDSVGNKVVLLIENRFGVFSKLKLDESKKLESAMSGGFSKSKINVPKSDKVEDILENLVQSGEKKYIGKKITLNVKDIPIADILNMISETSSFNIILDSDVLRVPNLTLKLTNIPWDQALDTILDLSNLVATKNGNILQITTATKYLATQQASLAAQTTAKQQEPLVTKIFPISYATLGEISGIITQYLTQGRGTLTQDSRTNSLIVKDTVEGIDRIRKIIDVLDTQTPQILIESKIVEVTERYSKDLGLTEGINFGYDPFGEVTRGIAPIGETAIDTGVSQQGPGFSIATAPASGARSFLGLIVNRFGRLSSLNLNLQLLEQESKAKIIASPRVITENKKAATINSTETTQFEQVTVNADGSQTPTLVPISANLSLNVTPQVTNEGSIALQVSVSKSDIGTAPAPGRPPDTTSRSVNTNVLVDNGSTIVIGGVYRMTSSLTHSGVPFLKDIPLVGWLFRTSYKPENSKSEMVIFLTPRIINQEEAGLLDKESSNM